MRFTEHFDIEPTDDDDWFDPLLSQDTALFVDPFLIFDDSQEQWRSAHDELIGFFNLVLRLVARSQFKRSSAHWKAAGRLLMFPEPPEFCLGLAQNSVRGSGSAMGLRDEMLSGAVEAIKAGITNVDHFEELTLFGPGIGVDRISDITCNVLKSHFIRYTLDVAKRHAVPLEQVGVRNVAWSQAHLRWKSAAIELPRNPFVKNGVLLTPTRFLREIPVLEPSDFWDWAWSNHNEDLRNEFNYEIGRKVDARSIVRLARRHPGFVREYVHSKEAEGAEPYDFNADDAMTQWWERGQELALANPLEKIPVEKNEFADFVKDEIIGNFVHAVEETDAWRLLWSDAGSPRSERIVQALFRAMVRQHCRANDIDLSAESNPGRGPVDFKFSAGWEARALVEIKLTNNSRYWDGLKQQTPQYMRSEQADKGFFVSVGFRASDFTKERMDRVREAARATSQREGIDLQPIFVDARPKESASKKRSD